MADYQSIATDPGVTAEVQPIALHQIGTKFGQVVVLDIGDGTGKDPLTKGQKTSLNSVSVVPASDATFSISQQKSASASPTTPAMANAASATVIAANTGRLGLVIVNTRTDTDLLLNLTAAASATALVARVGPRQAWVMSRDLGAIYTGAITGILAASGDDGNIYVQELTT